MIDMTMQAVHASADEVAFFGNSPAGSLLTIDPVIVTATYECHGMHTPMIALTQLLASLVPLYTS